jgi:hypothetical protein
VADHGGEVARSASVLAHAPQVELLRLSGVQPVQAVPAVDEAGAREEDVRGRTGEGGEPPEERRDHRRGLGSEERPVADVARVASVAGGAVGRVVEPIVVVGALYDGALPFDDDLTAPGTAEGGHRVGHQLLHGVGSVGRVAQVGHGKGAPQFGVAEDTYGHDTPLGLEESWKRPACRPGLGRSPPRDPGARAERSVGERGETSGALPPRGARTGPGGG